jgi:hypothetical protein
MSVLFVAQNPVQAQDATTETPATVRVVHASPGAPELDVLIDGERVAEILNYGTATEYLSVPSGDHQVQIVPTGQGADAAVIDEEMGFDSGDAYIVAVVGPLNDIEASVNEVNLDATDSGKARVRVINASPDVGGVDVAVAGGDNLFEGVDFKDATDYEDQDAGTYDLELHADDTVVLSAPGVVFEAGSVYDVVVIGQLSDQSLELLPLVTEVSPSCAALLGVGTDEDACIRVVHASPGAPDVDVYVSDTPVVEGLTFGLATEFVALPAGDGRAIDVTAAGGTQDEPILDAETDFDAGQAYQIIIVGDGDDLDTIISEVDLTPLPEEQARLRVIHASPDAEEVDVTVEGGETLFDDVDYKDVTDYLVVNADAYDLRVMKDDQVALSADDTTIEAGYAYDAVLIGKTADGSLQLLLLQANATMREGAVATPEPGAPVPVASPTTPEVVGTPQG